MQLFGTKGQRDKLKILQWDGTGRDSYSKSRPGHGTGQGFDILPLNGLGRDFDSLSPYVPGQRSLSSDF